MVKGRGLVNVLKTSSNATIDKLYAIYEQYAIQQKAEATDLAIRGHVVKFCPMEIFRTWKRHQSRPIHKGSGSYP